MHITLKHNRPTRLCYVGTTLRTLGDSLAKTRSPMQIGAEIYGHSGIESDIEVIQFDVGNARSHRVTECSSGFRACKYLPFIV